MRPSPGCDCYDVFCYEEHSDGCESCVLRLAVGAAMGWGAEVASSQWRSLQASLRHVSSQQGETSGGSLTRLAERPH